MASPTANKTSWKDRIARKISGQAKQNGVLSSSFEENVLDEFEAVTLSKTNPGESELLDWEVLTLAKQKNDVVNRAVMDSNHTDGVLVQGGNKTNRKTSANNKPLISSPILGGTRGVKSALKQDKRDIMDKEQRPASAGANSQRSTGNSSRRKLLTTPDSYLSNNRTPSPNVERKSSFKRNKGTKDSSSPSELDSGNTGGNFSKIRDTLRIKKGKKKSTKVAQYSIPELNFPVKYEDPFDTIADFSENPATTEGTGHEFIPVDVPHHKPEYCDHCQGAAMGHNQTLKCTKCDFIVHKKCEGRVFLKCNLRTETEAVLQRDRANEIMEEIPDPLLEKDIKSLTSSSEQTIPNGGNQSPSLNGNGGHSYANSEKAILSRKIREYNKKTTPVHHIHIKSRDTTIDYQGFVRVHMSIQRPIHVSTGVTRTNWYRLMRPVKEKPDPYGMDGAGALETAFYLPIDTNRLVHINNLTTTKELIITLLKKFCITDNPKKFSLYEEYRGDCRRLFEEDRPLTVILEGSVARRNSKLVLRDNLCSTIQWDAFSYPELQNFISILQREEEIYASRLTDCFALWKKSIQEELEQKTPEEKHLVNGQSHSQHPLTLSKHAPLVK